MQKWIKIILFVGLIILLTVTMTGCRSSRTEETPHASITPSLSVILGDQTPLISLTPLSAIATTPAATQAIPQPTLIAPPSQTRSPTPRSIEATQTYPPTPPESATQPTTSLPSSSPTEQSTTPTPTITEAIPTESATPEETENSAYPGPEVTDVQSYPGPEQTETQLYPGPIDTATQPNPSPQITNTPNPSSTRTVLTPTATQSATPTFLPSETVTPSPSPTPATGTPGVTPTELPPRRPMSPPPPGSNVSIWFSWNSKESAMLRSIVQSFQKSYPDVTFTLSFVPLDDLLTNYQEAAYLGQGPSLLLGPAQWGPVLFQGQLVTDLTPYVPFDYLTEINPAAMASGRFREALVSLPLSQHGVVMYRNSRLISSAPQSLEELSSLSHAATRAGNVGSYLERGAYFSTAALLGLGGKLSGDDNLPAFNEITGLEWLDLLHAYDEAGAVTFNTNRDLDMFKRGRVGIIIDGTWNIATLTQYIGADNLTIDPWPSFGRGHLSGWVEADSVYMNSSITGDNRFAALAFMGYLLDPNVQLRLAEVGHIPSVMTTNPRDHLIQQAMAALSEGVAYPITMDENILELYFNVLNNAIRGVFVNGINPESALQAASEQITQTIVNSTAMP